MTKLWKTIEEEVKKEANYFHSWLRVSRIYWAKRGLLYDLKHNGTFQFLSNEVDHLATRVTKYHDSLQEDRDTSYE